MIFLTSDNGVGWGEYAFFQKRCPYRPCFEVPLVVWGPWAPRTVADPVIVQDVTATALQLAGARVQGIDGASLLPQLSFGRGYARRSVPLYYGGSVFEALRWEATLSLKRSYLFTSYPDTGEFEIYDLAADPGQVANLYAGGRARAYSGSARGR